MDNKKYLTEENYEKGKKKIRIISLIIFVIGLLIGGCIITLGVLKQNNIKFKYSEENRIAISKQLETEKEKLLNKKTELEAKVEPVEDQIKKLEREPFTGFDENYYEREDQIEELSKSILTDKNTIRIITSIINTTSCSLYAEDNSLTSEYCSLNNQLKDINSDFNKSLDSQEYIPFYMFGGFIILVSCIISVSVYMVSKRREIAAFSVQQVMPIAQEGMETIAPTVTKVGKEMMEEMAPAYGKIAKEISKGIKEGMEDNKE